MSDHMVNTDHWEQIQVEPGKIQSTVSLTCCLLWNILNVPWLLWLRSGPQVSSFYLCFYLFLYSTCALLLEGQLLFIHMLQCCWGCFYKRTQPKSAAAPMPFQGLAGQGHWFFFFYWQFWLVWHRQENTNQQWHTTFFIRAQSIAVKNSCTQSSQT